MPKGWQRSTATLEVPPASPDCLVVGEIQRRAIDGCRRHRARWTLATLPNSAVDALARFARDPRAGLALACRATVAVRSTVDVARTDRGGRTVVEVVEDDATPR
jgi:hypothetical protein